MRTISLVQIAPSIRTSRMAECQRLNAVCSISILPNPGMPVKGYLPPEALHCWHGRRSFLEQAELLDFVGSLGILYLVNLGQQFRNLLHVLLYGLPQFGLM
jgi:hypothetical protein